MPIHTGAGAHVLLTGDIIVRILRTIFRDFVATFYSNFSDLYVVVAVSIQSW